MNGQEDGKLSKIHYFDVGTGGWRAVFTIFRNKASRRMGYNLKILNLNWSSELIFIKI